MTIHFTDEQIELLTKSAREAAKGLKSMSLEELLERIGNLEIKQFDKEVNVDAIIKRINESK